MRPPPSPTRRRTIRKPSSRPPPPPPESRLYQTMSDESEEESAGGSFSRVAPEREAIRGRLADGTELPRLPSIAPPKPPSEPNNDAEIGGLYEEIEYEFTLKSSNGNLAANSPSFSPRFARNSHERTPDRFRTSHPNLAPRDSNELYAEAEFEPLPEPRGTQTLGRASANAIAAALKSRNGSGGFGRSLGSNSAAMSTSMAPAQFDTWTGGKKPKANRPISALDLVKLDRLTNGIQQITRRFKQAKSQDPTDRARNFSTDRDTPSSLDSRLYGDEWDTEEDASDEEAESEARDDVLKYDVRRAAVFLLLSLSGINAKPLKLDRRLSAVVAMRASNSVDLETQSLCSSSFADEEAEMAAKNLVAELKAALPDEGDTESLSDLERKSLYESRLAAAQPLYQIYMLGEADPTAVLTAAAPEEHEADSICDSGSDDLASVTIRRRQSSSASTDSGRGADTISSRITSNNSMRRERLTVGSAFGSQRSLWCELPEVRSAGLLNLLDEPSKKLQESFFEVISSEASYLRSLNILIACFMCDPALKGAENFEERDHQLRAKASLLERGGHSGLTRLKNSLLLTDICDILCDHLESKFDAYKTYCANQVYQDRCLKRLKGQNSQFLAAINRIQSNPECQGLDIRSFP
ncbi:hypothetical protein M3Y99_01322900 [Aphelenchoides fujianensis]|nr:hypothetical protein M3Y99_01322900 [Aphelenchoides fujianensis]